MHGDGYGGGLAHIREVLLEPVQLFLDDMRVVGAHVAGLAVVIFGGRGIRAFNIVQDHIVDVADIEGVIGWSDNFLVLDHRVVVSEFVHAVVVVADGLVNREALDGLGIGKVVLVAVVVGLPVEVPCHVAEGEAVDRTA